MSWNHHNSLNFSACALWAGCPVQWSPWNASKGHRINIRPSSYQLLYRQCVKQSQTASLSIWRVTCVFDVLICCCIVLVRDVALTLSNVFSLIFSFRFTPISCGENSAENMCPPLQQHDLGGLPNVRVLHLVCLCLCIMHRCKTVNQKGLAKWDIREWPKTIEDLNLSET